MILPKTLGESIGSVKAWGLRLVGVLEREVATTADISSLRKEIDDLNERVKSLETST